MPVRHTISELVGFSGRGPGTDAERRAGLWLAEELRETGREVTVETFWCRPNWALAHAWHVGLALAGTLLSVPFPLVGFVLVAMALVCLLADEGLGVSPGRRLTRERASQNIVSRGRADPPSGSAQTTRLLITSNYDAGRTGLIFSRRVTRLRLGLRRLTRGRAPGWMAWLAVGFVWLAVIALVRYAGNRGTVVGILQLVPAAALIVALATLLEAAGSPYGPAAGDNGSGTATALALLRALDAAPPRHLAVEIAFCGAHEGGGIGLRRHLRRRRAERRRRTDQAGGGTVPGERHPEEVIVLGLAASAHGRPRWWRSDGPALPRRHSPALQRLARHVAAQAPNLNAAPHRGHGRSPARSAQSHLPRFRAPRMKTIALGALDAHGGVPHSHQLSDQPDVIDAVAADRVLEFALLLVDAVDAELGRRPRTPPRPPVPA